MAVALGVCSVGLASVSARSDPANTLVDLSAELHYCLRSADLDKGAEVTLRLSLKRDGSLNGKPIVTYFNMSDDADAERRNAQAITTAVGRCVPIPISDALGRAIAGTPFWIHLRGAPVSTLGPVGR